MQPAASKKITIIEDDPDYAHYMKLLLTSEFLSPPTHFDNGLTGLQCVLSDPPDMLVLDLELPGLRGEEVCRLVKSSPFHRTIPVLICSSMPEPEKKEMELLKIGADAYLPKPFVDIDFLEAVKRLLNASKKKVHPDDRTTPAGIELPESIDEVEGTRVESGPPEVYAGYEIHEIIGMGGMGTVYRATQVSLNREVALKVLLRRWAKSEKIVERFQREAKIMGQLNHPNIVHLFDVGQTEYTYFIAMEYVSGKSLQNRIEAQNLSWEECVGVIRQSFNALIYLHEKGVIHRDIKPSNLILTLEGAVKLGDFGISRAQNLFSDKDFTMVGAMIGTPRYMAPEQLAGGEATEQSDQYALARTLHHMLEGPKLSVPVRKLHESQPDLPVALSEAFAKAMHSDPAQRFPSAREAKEAVLAACAEYSPPAAV